MKNRSAYFIFLISLCIYACSKPDSGGAIGNLPGTTTLSANAIDGVIHLSWPQVSGAVSYKLYWSTEENFQASAATGVITVPSTSYSHEGLENGTSYYYVVTAINNVGEGAPSSIITATPIAVPTKPAIVTITPKNTALEIAWTPQANVSSFDLLISSNPGMSGATVHKNVTSPYLVTALVNGQQYYVSIQAQNNSGNSGYTIPMSATPTKTYAIAAGGFHNCTIKSDRSAWCWGRNHTGQSGNGSTPNYPKTIPINVYDNAVQQWQMLTGGDYSSCGIDISGGLWCWGGNSLYQLGNGSTTPSVKPVRVGSDSDWLTMDSGSTFSCAIKSDHSLWCWGGNNLGQTGSGESGAMTEVHVPSQVGTDTDWAQVSLGLYISCALKLDGSLWCWGDSLETADEIPVTTPTQVGTDSDWRMVNAGIYHVCGIKTDNSLWCWGYNYDGQVGVGTNGVDAYVSSPTQVGTDTDWLMVAGGGFHTCALKEDNSLWCWGYNEYGALGDGTQIDRNTPLRIGASNDWVDLALNWYHTCARKRSGDVFCWGSNGYGELGDGEVPRMGLQDSYTPTLASNNTDWLKIANGYGHTCATKSNNSAWCWGVNNGGQLGDDSYVIRVMPTEVVGDRDWLSFQTTSSGGTACGIKADHSLWCWGRGVEGQLGNNTSGTDVYSALPLSVDSATDWNQVAPGFTHVCATKIDGTLWCWGESSYGKLGIGSGADVSAYETVPRQVGTDIDWNFIATGGWHTCAIKTDHSLWCWGANDVGQIGNDLGTGAIEVDTPVQVGSDTDWASVVLGGTHSCALKQDSSAWCWGDNWYGQRGDTVLEPDLTPQLIGGITNTWTTISAGYNATCGVRSDQTLWCWGANYNGQLGVGYKLEKVFSPLQVAPGTSWRDVGVGEGQGCGIKSDGTLWCWGSNEFGNLGDGRRLKTTPQLVLFP